MSSREKRVYMCSSLARVCACVCVYVVYACVHDSRCPVYVYVYVGICVCMYTMIAFIGENVTLHRIKVVRSIVGLISLVSLFPCLKYKTKGGGRRKPFCKNYIQYILFSLSLSLSFSIALK